MHDGGVFVYQVVKAPGNLVISAYVTCPDITLTVTPDLKLPGAGRLLWVDLAGGQRRLGGSALAQAYSQARPKARDCCRVPLLSLCGTTELCKASAFVLAWPHGCRALVVVKMLFSRCRQGNAEGYARFAIARA